MDDAELLDILEPHYVNMGFAWGEEAREAARKSVTFKQLKARDAAVRIDELSMLGRLPLNNNQLEKVVHRIDMLKKEFRTSDLVRSKEGNKK